MLQTDQSLERGTRSFHQAGINGIENGLPPLPGAFINEMKIPFTISYRAAA
jgi:hypothetical protein